MIRTQIQVTDEQAKLLKVLSISCGVSIAELIRRSIEGFLRGDVQAGELQDIWAQAKEVVGMFESDTTDGSVRHDAYIADSILADIEAQGFSVREVPGQTYAEGQEDFSTGILCDTSALYAVLVKKDVNHTSAAAAWNRIVEGETLLFVHNYIIVETIALLQHRIGLEAVRAFQNGMQPVLRTLWVERETHEKALAALTIANRRNLSLTDCVSFQVMRDSGIKTAFAFDGHFTERGFGEVRHEVSIHHK